jgi:MFS family permease
LSKTTNLAYSKANAYLIFFLAASFYLYEYILQVAPSVMQQSMMSAFGVGAAGFGTISAFYFYAYAPMQLPAGLLFDTYGPRRLICIALMICASGAIFIALTNSVLMASMGRFFIGFGSAFSFIGVLVLISRWFPPYQFAMLAGITQAMSSLGAIFGQVPLAALMSYIGWRNVMFLLAFIGFVLGGLVWLIVRDCPRGDHYQFHKINFRYEWKKLLVVCRKLQTWWIGLYAGSIWTPIAVFGALWGIPYLETKYHVSTLSASTACTMIWLGIAIGSPLLGVLSDYIKNRKLVLMLSAIMGLVACILLLYVDAVSFKWCYGVLFLLGLGAGGQTLSFALVKDNNKPELVGSASGFNNLCVLIGAAIFQPLVGYTLSFTWNNELVNNIPIYSVQSYKNALLILPACYLVSLITAIFFIKESYDSEL